MKWTKTILMCSILAGFMMAPACTKKAPGVIDKDAKSQYDAGIAYLKQGRTKEAILSLQEADKKDPNHPDIQHMLGMAYFQSGSLDLALQYMQKAEVDDPKNPDLKNNLANLLLGLNRYQDAIDKATAAIDNPDYFTPTAAYYVRAMAYLGLNQTQNAETDLKQAIQLDPYFDRPHLRLGDLYLQSNRLDDAQKELNQAITANKNNAEAYLLRGRVVYAKGLLTDAENDFTKVIRLLPESHPMVKEAKAWLEKVR